VTKTARSGILWVAVGSHALSDSYRGRNVIERMFCRLKDFRRIATRNDKRAGIFMSSIALAATVAWWLN
jgi:transposase